MSTATISRTEYGQLLKNQERLIVKVAYLESLVKDFAEDEVSDAYARKLERISKQMDAGKGLKFKTVAEFSKYLKNESR